MFRKMTWRRQMANRLQERFMGIAASLSYCDDICKLLIMKNSAETKWHYLAPKPGSYYRQLFVKGRNIFAYTLYCMSVDGEEPGMTPEQIADDYDLPLEAVLEAIKYCKSNPPEIRQDWEADEALAEATGMNDPDYKYHPVPKILSPQEKARLSRP